MCTRKITPLTALTLPFKRTLSSTDMFCTVWKILVYPERLQSKAYGT